jgi:LuxR family maltose regulon positive regulatory protein
MVDSAMGIHTELAEKYREIGFPDTQAKLDNFVVHRRTLLRGKPYIIVCDDVHLLKDPTVLDFMGKMVGGLSPNLTIFLIYRNFPDIDIKTFQTKGLVSEITESDLNFTQTELSDYLKQQGLSIDSQTVRDIYTDTGGWTFAVNLVARSLKRVPKYTGFVKPTLKPNIFGLMESENWNTLSERLRRFLLQLSLIDHISAELAVILAESYDEGALVLEELKQQNAYIRHDGYGGAYLIHRLYLEFLKSKQNLLSDEEKAHTYRMAAFWCNQNNFKVDALRYYEKLGDYGAIIGIAWEMYEYMTDDVLLCLSEIIERAPAQAMFGVDFMPSFHLYTLVYLGQFEKFFDLVDVYVQKLLALPEDNSFRNRTLGAIYFIWGKLRFVMCTIDGGYDFDEYVAKGMDYWMITPADVVRKIIFPYGAWVSTMGSSQSSDLEKYGAAVKSMVEKVAPFYSGIMGFENLYYGELKFYQGDIRGAEVLFRKTLEFGQNNGQFETVQRSLFYLLRTAIAHGNVAKTENALKELELLLDESGFSRRNVTHDIVKGWYCCTVCQYEMISDWLKGEFVPYSHAHFIDNYSNQIRARYHYLKRNYPLLLGYISEMKKRESILYGRVEMLALEACTHYKMKNKSAAWESLTQAYEAALPNKIYMPFVELGKDMRTLTSSAMRDDVEIAVPNAWLELMKQKSSSYAKYQSVFINEQKSGTPSNKVLSPREYDVLRELYSGATQAEIAKKHSLSINTVKMVTKSIYEKLHVHKISDLIRVAAERNLV